jgi:hypothetical protein
MATQAYQVLMAGRSQGLDPTMQGITRQRGRDSDGKRNARTPSKTRAMYGSAHLLNAQDRHIFDKPIEERFGITTQ